MPAHLLSPGTQLGRYEVVVHLATGGMGEVYRARDVGLGREVALKTLRPKLADSPSAIERFRREARAAARLCHKNIVSLYDWGMDHGVYYLALEFVDGTDLYSHIDSRGRLDPQEAWTITLQSVRGLEHAFGQGITHRDIKPANILLRWSQRSGRVRVKLTDFGLALHGDEDFRVTRDGSTVGTIDYLAPEQARNSSAADVRSDIYSLGCTLYHMLAGHPPFPEGGVGERIYRHMQVEPPDVRQFNGDVPSGLWEVLRKMLAKRPEDRYATPTELHDALMKLSSGRRRSSRPTPSSEEHVVEVLSPSRTPAHTMTPECTPSDVLGLSGEQSGPASAPGGLGDLAARAFVKAARQAGDHRKVLEQGELILSRSPGDVDTLMDMADAATALGLQDMELSLLARACGQAPTNPEPPRRLALAHERRRDPAKAIAAWRAVQKARPEDSEADLKIDTLLRHLARAYERQDDRDKALLVWQAVLKARPDDAEAASRIEELSGELKGN